MQFTIERKKLAAALTAVNRVVEKRSSIPILRNCLLQANAGDSLAIIGTDLETGITIPVDAEVNAPGAITLPAADLLKHVKALKDDTLTLSVDGELWATVTAGGSTCKFPGLHPANFPELPQVKKGAPKPVTLPADLLTDMIARTVFAISDEDSRFTLNGALFELDGKTLKVTTTDGHRMAHCEAKVADKSSGKYLIRRSVMEEIRKLIKEQKVTAISFTADEDHQYFEIGDARLLSRKLTGNFPDYHRVIPEDPGRITVVNRKALLEVLKAARPFADERSRCITITIKESTIRIFAHTKDRGAFNQTIPSALYMGTLFEIGMNVDYWIDFLSVDTGEEITLEFYAPDKAMILRPTERKVCASQYIVMPMRTGDEPAAKPRPEQEAAPTPKPESLPDPEAHPEPTEEVHIWTDGEAQRISQEIGISAEIIQKIAGLPKRKLAENLAKLKKKYAQADEKERTKIDINLRALEQVVSAGGGA